jgi:L-ascorbate metabolism protein UlaG (beta-lactamase superfamily)
MKLKWFGHSSFLITSDQGTRVITDPYTSGQGLDYAPIMDSAEAITVSHEHGDHNNPQSIKGNPKVLKGEGNWKIGGIEIRVVSSFHDEEKGAQRGKNSIFCFTVDGINVRHLGDLGQLLTAAQIEEIGPVDVILIPVGGFFTIDAAQAGKVVASLKPKITIPMHYKTPKCSFPLAGVEAFLQGKPRVIKPGLSEVHILKGELPAQPEIRVLDYSQ